MDKRLREAHDSTAHVVTPCPHCRVPLPAYQLPSHKCRKAPNPPKPCTFCQAEIPYEDYVDHVKDCGSRTQQCPTCRKYIQSWEIDKHVASCITNPPVERPQKVANRPYPSAESETKARVDPGKVGASRALGGKPAARPGPAVRPGAVAKPGPAGRPALKPGTHKPGKAGASKAGPPSGSQSEEWAV